MSKFGAFSGTRFGGLAASKFGARGTGVKIHDKEFTETSSWTISGTVKHWRTVGGAKDPTPDQTIAFSGITPNFQFYKAYGAMFGISTHEYETIRFGGYVGTFDAANDTLDPTKHPGFTRWATSINSPEERLATATASDMPQGGGVGMGVDSSFVRFDINVQEFVGLDSGAGDVAPDGFLMHGAELDSGNGPATDFDKWRIMFYFPVSGINSFYTGDNGAPNFFAIRSLLEVDVVIDIVG